MPGHLLYSKGSFAMSPFLQAVSISKVFPGVRALTDVSLDFYKGEVHAIMGENGAGKSTLIKILSGVYTPSKGEILLNGNKVSFANPREALNRGVAVIHQELSIAKDLTVAENIFLGDEPSYGRGVFVDRRAMKKRTDELLEFLNEKNIKSGDIAGELTAAQQQMIEIAKVVNKNAQIVIMDEPTSSLSDHEIASLFRQIRILKEHGAAIAYISHRMAEIFEMCDKVTILRDGCKVKTCMLSETSEADIVASMVGREIKNYYNYTARERGKEMLRVEDLSRGREFKNISFSAHAGEILGFAGLVGAGRTEVMETVFGARQPDSGKVYIEGAAVSFKSPKDAIKCHMGLVTEDRRTTGLMLQAMLKHNVVLPSLAFKHKKFGLLDVKWENETAKESIRKFNIKAPGIETVLENLSGGNQQKVILAKWLVANSKILILDEPTRGIDVNAKSEFYKLMIEFVENGGCIIMVSSELPEILGISDRVIVMCEGALSGELPRAEATEQSIMQLASVHS